MHKLYDDSWKCTRRIGWHASRLGLQSALLGKPGWLRGLRLTGVPDNRLRILRGEARGDALLRRRAAADCFGGRVPGGCLQAKVSSGPCQEGRETCVNGSKLRMHQKLRFKSDIGFGFASAAQMAVFLPVLCRLDGPSFEPEARRRCCWS